MFFLFHLLIKLKWCRETRSVSLRLTNVSILLLSSSVLLFHYYYYCLFLFLMKQLSNFCQPGSTETQDLKNLLALPSLQECSVVGEQVSGYLRIGCPANCPSLAQVSSWPPGKVSKDHSGRLWIPCEAIYNSQKELFAAVSSPIFPP